MPRASLSAMSPSAMPHRLREPPVQRRVARALDRLQAAFGRPRWGRRLPPLDELVLTILSQNTSDRNRDRAYASLRGRFPSWDRVLRADRARLEDALRVGGLARTKSRVILDILRRIKADHGRLSLDFLRSMEPQEARRYLTSFRGVGEKTACCVLLFSCDHPAFPVDTHILRVTKRLGWIRSGATPERAHAILGRLIPTERYLAAHVNLITLGRRHCRPRAPTCPACPLRRDCAYARVLPHLARAPAARRPRT